MSCLKQTKGQAELEFGLWFNRVFPENREDLRYWLWNCYRMAHQHYAKEISQWQRRNESLRAELHRRQDTINRLTGLVQRADSFLEPSTEAGGAFTPVTKLPKPQPVLFPPRRRSVWQAIKDFVRTL